MIEPKDLERQSSEEIDEIIVEREKELQTANHHYAISYRGKPQLDPANARNAYTQELKRDHGREGQGKTSSA
jgi:hypothetical protein